MMTGKKFTFVKELRNRTGCTLMLAKQAGEFTNWDFDKGEIWIKENGYENTYKEQVPPDTLLLKCMKVLEKVQRALDYKHLDLHEEIAKLLEEYSDKLWKT